MFKYKIGKSYLSFKDSLKSIIDNFETSGEVFGNQNRNTIKLFKFQDRIINVKSFKVPNLINQLTYRFFRKSKAQRSFEYAKRLQSLGIGTPDPIAYYEFSNLFLFKKSYYISEHLEVDLTFRELNTDLNYQNQEEIIRAFTKFTFSLHEKGINFLDHSPGNTLIKKTKTGYEFFLVDLNRMRFETMDFASRMKNISKLTVHKPIIKTISNEYSKLFGEKEDVIYESILNETERFQAKFQRKRALKKKLKFWRK